MQVHALYHAKALKQILRILHKLLTKTLRYSLKDSCLVTSDLICDESIIWQPDFGDLERFHNFGWIPSRLLEKLTTRICE